jgi:hypothetical protein
MDPASLWSSAFLFVLLLALSLNRILGLDSAWAK